MKKAIIFYPHIGEYGGIERNIIALATEVLKKGHTPVLVCFYDHINMSKYLDGLVTVQIGDHLIPFVKSFRIKKWLAQNKNEVVGLPFFFGGKAGFYGAFFSKNYVLHYTDPPSLLSSNLKEIGLKRWISAFRSRISDQITHNGVHNAQVCITMTNWNARELETLYGRSFDVVYQGGLPPLSIINEAKRCTNETLLIFSISRLTASKNLDWILEAVQHLKNNIPLIGGDVKKIEVVIAGSGPQFDHLKKLSEKLDINELVCFPGFLTEAQVDEEYHRADLFLVPARQGFGLPILEALYRNVPVVINKESRISELLTNNPWVAISDNTSESFKKTVVKHILALRKQYPDNSILSTLPTEQGWAVEIGNKCQWW